MGSSHLFHLEQEAPDFKTSGGFRKTATKHNFPLLNGMSIYRLTLFPNGVREPHWHANSDELGYCLKGQALVSLYGTSNIREVFLVSEGEAFLISSGFLHLIENVGSENCEMILQFSSDSPEDFAISSALGMFSDAVLGNTWKRPSATFAALKRSTSQVFAALRSEPVSIPEQARYSNAYRYALESASPLVATAHGTAKVARHDSWPIVQNQALYSLQLTGTGMREPHWHPETAELGFVQKGKGRMSILSPDGSLDTYEMNEGDIYFIPKAYPHHIENLGTTPLHLLIFFDQAMPEDIGFTASVKSASNDTMGAVMNISPTFFEKLPTYYKDLFIVEKLNPVD